MQMQVPGYARAAGLAYIQSEVEAVGAIEAFERALGLLRQIDQLMGGFSGQRGQTVQMCVRHYHYVAGGVGVGIEADKAVLAAQDQAAGGLGLLGGHAVGDGVIDRGNQVAEDAVVVTWPSREACWNAGAAGCVGRSYVGITPGSPEMIHGWESVCISIEGAALARHSRVGGYPAESELRARIG